jgi:pimeloyl-ACP methyl ester carboxylesterase
MWDGQMELLTHKFRVLRYDTRDHGRSDALDGAYANVFAIESFVDELALPAGADPVEHR